MRLRWAFALGFGLAAVGTASQAQAAVIDYTNFSSTVGLTLNGNAAQVGSVLRVTSAVDGEAGSFFSTNTVSLASNASFSTYFQFQFTNPDLGFCDGPTTCGADGLVFVVQTVANNVGGAGGGIGYFGIPNSVGIEFDNWNNGSIDDNSSNHVGIDINGDVDSVGTVTEITEADLNDGDIWSAWIDYDGSTGLLEVRLNRSGIRPAGAMVSTSALDLASILGSTDAFVGFTSGTGASNANHDVLSWTLENTFAPITTGSVPEPSSIALFGLGAFGVALARRRS